MLTEKVKSCGGSMRVGQQGCLSHCSSGLICGKGASCLTVGGKSGLTMKFGGN